MICHKAPFLSTLNDLEVCLKAFRIECFVKTIGVKKRFLNVFMQGTFFYVFNVFYFANVFFYLKKS